MEPQKKPLQTKSIDGTLKLFKGCPEPLGVSASKNGFNFAVFSSNADALSLIIFNGSTLEIPLDPSDNCTKNIWHM